MPPITSRQLALIDAALAGGIAALGLSVLIGRRGRKRHGPAKED